MTTILDNKKHWQSDLHTLDLIFLQVASHKTRFDKNYTPLHANTWKQQLYSVEIFEISAFTLPNGNLMETQPVGGDEKDGSMKKYIWILMLSETLMRANNFRQAEHVPQSPLQNGGWID